MAACRTWQGLTAWSSLREGVARRLRLRWRRSGRGGLMGRLRRGWRLFGVFALLVSLNLKVFKKLRCLSLADTDRLILSKRPPDRFQTRTLRPRIPSESNSTRTHDARKTKPRRNPLTTPFTTRDRKPHPDTPTDYRRRKAPNNQIREDSNHHHHNHHNRTPLVHHPRPAQRPHHSRTSRRRLHARGESASRGLRTGGFG